ncbi:uncharacterized protein LOC115447367 [Manduca sexta]|uniref:uncharacterized protein LOC115447367 n=1 Tax=Manduca sexta TaxID=7130 RepID=UPI00118419C6|nr:uncharacterized protein LOC115447367 [Manduca sexta]
MCRKVCVLLVLAVCLFTGINCYRSKKAEEQCVNYYSNGETFDLTELSGSFYAVYFWPPKQRQRDSCEVIDFRVLSPEEIYSTKNECRHLEISNETAVRATYTNSTGKIVNLVYFGNKEVKTLYRSCDRDIHAYIFSKVNDNYVLGIDCSSGGFGVLMSRTYPSLPEVYNTVNSIEIMTGRDGSQDCELRRL